MMDLLAIPLGWIMYFCYGLVKNYGFALLLFTLITKIAMLPFAVNQQKNSVKMVMMKPRMDEIQKKYKDDPQRQNEEMTALYQRENYNMMSGCLPLFVQFPILIGLIRVIYQPLKHILRIAPEAVATATEIMKTVLTDAQMNKYSTEISIISAFKQNPGAFGSLGAEFASKLSEFDFTFLGIDLGGIPNYAFSALRSPQGIALMLIPILSGLSALVMSYFTNKSNPAMQGNTGTSAMTYLMMPAMSIWIAVTVPAGVSIYWLMSNVYAIVQQRILNKIYNPKEVAEKIKLQMEEEKEAERLEKAEAKKRLKALGKDAISEEEAQKALSQKELNRRRLAEARKRDAEKYGEEYVEATERDVE